MSKHKIQNYDKYCPETNESQKKDWKSEISLQEVVLRFFHLWNNTKVNFDND